MQTGIRQPVLMDKIVAAMKVTETKWTALSANERCQQITTAVLGALRQVFVPLPTLEIKNLGPGLNGQFSFIQWSLNINSSMAVGNVRMTPNERKAVIASLGDVITHEARHCEQWWRMMRMIVADMRAKGILPTLQVLESRFPGVLKTVIAQAVKAVPMTPPEVEETRPWYGSVYGEGQSFREINVLGRNLRPTEGRFKDVGRQFQVSEFARYERGLAEEDDAHQTGRAIQQLFLLGSGIPPKPLIGHRPVARGVAHY